MTGKQASEQSGAAVKDRGSALSVRKERAVSRLWSIFKPEPPFQRQEQILTNSTLGNHPTTQEEFIRNEGRSRCLFF